MGKPAEGQPVPVEVTGAVPRQAPVVGGIPEQTAAEYIRRFTHTETPAEEGARASIYRTLAQLGGPMRLTGPKDDTRIKT